MEKQSKAPAESIKAAGETQKRAVLECAQAAAEVGAHADRLLRAQLDHAAAAQRTASEFFSKTLETSLKTQETLRRTGLELVETFVR